MKKTNKDNPDKYYTDNYQDHIACSYGYKLVCVDHRFSKSVQMYRGENAIYKLIIKMFEEV